MVKKHTPVPNDVVFWTIDQLWLLQTSLTLGDVFKTGCVFYTFLGLSEIETTVDFSCSFLLCIVFVSSPSLANDPKSAYPCFFFVMWSVLQYLSKKLIRVPLETQPPPPPPPPPPKQNLYRPLCWDNMVREPAFECGHLVSHDLALDRLLNLSQASVVCDG